MKKTYDRVIRPLMGVLLCAVSAAGAVVLFGHRPRGAALPLLFLAVVFLVAARFGALVGILGTLAAALVFAYFLFPLGKFAVEDPAARSNIGWMLLGGTVISFLLAPGLQEHKH